MIRHYRVKDDLRSKTDHQRLSDGRLANTSFRFDLLQFLQEPGPWIVLCIAIRLIPSQAPFNHLDGKPRLHRRGTAGSCSEAANVCTAPANRTAAADCAFCPVRAMPDSRAARSRAAKAALLRQLRTVRSVTSASFAARTVDMRRLHAGSTGSPM
jgi:hypothetical protein